MMKMKQTHNDIEIDFSTEVSSILLEMGKWRLHFQEDDVKLALAEAINSAIIQTEIPLNGYLITNWQVYLITTGDAYELNRFVNHIVRNLMRQYIRRKQQESIAAIEMKQFNVRKYDRVFKFYPFYNEFLRLLLLGREPHISYEDPGFEYLKEQLSNYKYCSVPAYKGERGPVFVRRI